MSDKLLERLDALVGSHEAAIVRLRRFRDLYVGAPEIRDVIASLLNNEPPTIELSGAATGGVSATATLSESYGRLASVVEAVVREEQGLDAATLINRVLKRFQPKSKRPRKAVAASYGALVDQERLVRRDGKFYLP